MPGPGPRALALRTTGITYPGRRPDRVVRADLRALLDGCPMADDVIVCASELATNAMLHSHSGLPGETFTVRGKVKHGDYLWMEVEDEGGPGIRRTPIGTWARLDIVEAVASDWGLKAITTAGPSGRASTGPSPDGDLHRTGPSGGQGSADGQRVGELRRQRGLARPSWPV